MKKAAAEAALKYVEDDTVVGVGTGSTVNFFIDALASRRARIEAAVASSEASAKRLRELKIPVRELNDTDGCAVYVDGADEAPAPGDDQSGGARSRAKIVAAAARRCLHRGPVEARAILGRFPLPVEVIPMARSFVAASS